MEAIVDTEAARDMILGRFASAWAAGTPAVNGGEVPEVEYQNVSTDGAPLSDGAKPWVRMTVTHSRGGQRSFGGLGSRRFTRAGVLTVQIFVPAGEQGLALADRLSKVAIDAFEGEETESGDVWFRNVTSREIGMGGAWFQVNVNAEFQYDVIK